MSRRERPVDTVNEPAIAVHAGAGRITPDRHAVLRAACREAASAGRTILDAGGSALDAAVAAVRVLEDHPETNAGRGSVLARDQTIETDAAIMDGAQQRVGAVAAVPGFGQAIALARAVLDDGEHVLLAGRSALAFAIERGLVAEPAGPLVTERAVQRWRDEAQRRAGGTGVEHEREGGTVGAVVRDREGRFAAATSTGGIAFKRPGRVGDSPIPGAGTWADARCAVSATGDGEAILRVALGHAIAMHARMGIPLVHAVHEALRELQAITGGSAGVIAIDQDGVAIAQLSPTMPVAWIDAHDKGDSMGQPIDA